MATSAKHAKLPERLLPEGFFGPVEYAARTRYRRLPGFYRRLQRRAPVVKKLGVTPGYVVELQVPGRRSGVPRRTLLVRVRHRGEDYLVSLTGESEWVRNVRAAGGHVVFTDNARTYAAQLCEVPVAARADVIRAYVHRPSPRGRAMVRTSEARHYFGVEPDALPEELRAIAGGYPVFRIAAGPPAGPGGVARDAAPGIVRASATDRAMMALGGREVPAQIGALLLLDDARTLDRDRVSTVLQQRISAVPQLRRRIERVPLGCGGPVWVDDPDFDVRRHVGEITVPEGIGEQDMYDVALGRVMTPVPWTAPPWAVAVLREPDGRTVGLVMVMHHVLADGVGGLAVLAAVVDPGAPRENPSPLVPIPSRRDLAAQAWRQRLQSVRRFPRWQADYRRSMAAGGGWRGPRAAVCSLLRPTGPQRRMVTASADLTRLAPAAHALGATVNDVLLVAIGAAIAEVLAARGERVDPLMVVVPVSGRGGGAAELGNVVAPLLVPVPTTGVIASRVARVSAYVRAQKQLATGPPPIATLGWLFRPVAALGGYHWYMNRQRRLHTLVTHVRGPRIRVCFDGRPVRGAVPIVVGDNGNVAVHFTVMSYAGTLTVAAIADPRLVPELDALADAISRELGRLVRARPGDIAPGASAPSAGAPATTTCTREESS